MEKTDGSLSPLAIFGISDVYLKKIIRGLADLYPDYIHVEMTMGLDNVFLIESYRSIDISKLA